MRKQDRQRIIKKIIQENTVYRQEDFVALLSANGVEVTQATISRDVKEMQLIKLPTPDGSYRYSLPTTKQNNTEKKLIKVLKDAYLMSDCHRDMCMIKVLPGNGPALSSLISQMNYPEVFASLGDDDTVLLFARSNEDANAINTKLTALVDET
ncbi:arginine repressor [Ligilactobacillus apodemi]|uniref:Arginine repressor n=1 Tax=Ligilactobacillus apodemi DSM 16634 = JCM 16172 TaxID=1423724 RepID=A0A0R1TQQ1_9LACO|nr:ArgR family transcriptional regulator [Ligilactobacillus apodemi]KRL83772.1 arginine repressor [Ligilactobacillus apodemi DSM 16634 = JCM 16172]MCR1900630.1 ArgR family transcriptional regulator [Ligilactobacillus apodemi]